MLVAAGLAFSVGNIWVTLARSTIPVSLSGTVTDKELREEKHPGVDDVYLVTFSDGRVIQVDRSVFVAARVGAPLEKEAWSRRLRTGEQDVDLDLSTDARRMFILMPLAAALVLVAARKRGARLPCGG